MPAWPTQQRDDEVWAMVAFLRLLPELDGEAYRRLVHGEAAADSAVAPVHGLLPAEQTPRAVIENCGRCHGRDGRGRGAGAFPKLAGQRSAYLYAALRAYARRKRYSGMMEPIAAGLSPAEMRELARYYGNLKGLSPSPESLETTKLAIARGKAIAHRGIPEQRIPSCVDCHGPGATRRNPLYPVLAGQYADYLIIQLKLFKKRHRGGSAYAHLMHPAVTRLNAEQMRDVALYYQSLTSPFDSPAR
jgi:cytochrome c553